MKKIQARKLKGFQDYSGQVMQHRFRIMDEVRRVAREAEFNAVQTPAIEYAEVLLGEGGDTDKQVFKWDDNGGRAVALRYDLTVPFARYVAENSEIPMPFKRFQIGDVWRAEKPQKGRFREFCQCDFDIIGVDSLSADVEIILAILKVLSNIDIGGFTMTIGHRHVLSGLLRKFIPGIFDHPTGEEACLITIDKLDKIGSEKVCESLSQIPGAEYEGAKSLLQVLEKRSGSGSDIGAVRDCLKDDEKASSALLRVEEILALLEKTMSLRYRDQSGSDNPSENHRESNAKIVADFKIARGLAYYTGVVFETTLDALPAFGSISSGGRYDNLIERFVDRHLPGVGGSIGLDRLVAAIMELDTKSNSKRAGIFVIPATEGAECWAFEVAEYLRMLGIGTDVALKSAKLGKQFAHADKLQKKFVLVIGKDELSSRTVTLKNLDSGEQHEKLSLQDALSFLKA